MIYTEKTKRALRLCFEAHKNQTDKSGLPYVFHPFHLAEQMTDEATTITALLHDVAEDTHYTFEDLAAMDFGDDVMTALRLLTHDDDTPYMDYILRLRDNPIARAVKLADLAHNSDSSRLDYVDDRSRAREEKYRQAMALLNEPFIP
ncbi:MAG: bifunctional (p)ppGpp synthetase/guanosine-3',5'-bis(diphosphate) 3'-pyrophosphohydrolase [Oscillospiraceae bacterium]|nr:bifunctional (p)ppGpp synthetase/guanosine-3',5'-bis(diphosphate) 3'-pyrophosphohydrolase [Oscillospiraceae bacterium]